MLDKNKCQQNADVQKPGCLDFFFMEIIIKISNPLLN